MTPLRSFLALPSGHRRLALRAGLLLVRARCVLALRGAAPFRDLIDFGDDRDPAVPTPDQLRLARRSARLIEAWQRRLPGRWTCLPAAIAHALLLRAHGIPCRVRLGAQSPAAQLSSPAVNPGVNSDRAAFQAHAWVELGGEVLLGGLDSSTTYTPFAPPALSCLGRVA